MTTLYHGRLDCEMWHRGGLSLTLTLEHCFVAGAKLTMRYQTGLGFQFTGSPVFMSFKTVISNQITLAIKKYLTLCFSGRAPV